jgi:MYXO-CTERM domain-containing protein
LNQVLNVKGIDTLSNSNNEAQNYGAPLLGPGYQVFLGYADNTHTGPCGAWATSIGLNGSATCFPQVFFGASNFDGAPALLPDQLVLDQTLPNHCPPGSPTCYEGGVIRIVATSVPVPDHAATMPLLLAGLAAIGAGRWRRRRDR